ncbi:hypothetical protein KIL84_021782 [Mauremys mutica]|uniref:Uncharacterized protein n=1 Tax=Mauremys mutica TaxID=74926 RepID=A0A9D3XCN5_9SAUR|nr:hypothetical protein KIL84_021782 [Mauremys mutica]
MVPGSSLGTRMQQEVWMDGKGRPDLPRLPVPFRSHMNPTKGPISTGTNLGFKRHLLNQKHAGKLMTGSAASSSLCSEVACRIGRTFILILAPSVLCPGHPDTTIPVLDCL